MTDHAVGELAGRIGVRDACLVVGASQAGYYRRHRLSLNPWTSDFVSPRG